MAKKQIFLLYSCDEWKSKPMSLICASTSATQLRNAIIACIKADEMEYEDGTESKTKHIQHLRSDWKSLTREDINNRLRYGFYDYSYSGELMN